jgi:hypothetical protein
MTDLCIEERKIPKRNFGSEMGLIFFAGLRRRDGYLAKKVDATFFTRR